MKPINFEEQNITLGVNQSEYLPLPANKSAPPTVITTCWRMTILERIKTFFTGKIYVKIMTCGKPPQPQFLSTKFKD